MDTLHDKFVLSVQCMDSRYKVFEVITEWIQHLRTEPLEDLNQPGLDLTPDLLNEIKAFVDLEQETWSLISILYYFRLAERAGSDELPMVMDNPEVDVTDEKSSVYLITERNPAVKEVRLILEWLESNVAKQPEPDLLEKFINWEQTLDTLKRDQKLGVNITKPLVSHMDPDACYREGKEIHPFDSEEDAKVMRGAYYYVRSGRVEKAVEFLFESGHVATAAMLNGFWYSEKMPLNLESDLTRGDITAYDDIESTNDAVNMNHTTNTSSPTSQTFGILGNAERDMWKCTAFEVCEMNGLSKYARAALGALCGHRKAILDVATNWEDKLWAYLKIMYDVRIEGELRRLSNADLVPMTDEYWAQDTSLSECMELVEVGGTDFVRNTLKVFQLVQKHVITDDIEGLLASLREGLTKLLANDEYTAGRGHLMRFLTHLLLAFGIVGLACEEDLMNICTEAYIKVLVREGKLECIPFYVEKLSAEKQIPVMVEQIRPDVESDRSVIEVFMQAAHVNNLDVLGTANAIVAKLRDTQENFDVESLFWITSCYQLVPDSRDVMLSFLRNSITITRMHLILSDLPKCSKLIRQINDSCITEVLSLSEDYDDTLIREYYCYKVYLEAEDSLLLWQRSLTQQPRTEDMNFSFPEINNIAERTLQEKKHSDLKMSEEKWRKAINHHLKNCIEKFFSVLKFPNGWLVDCVTPTNEDEFNSVKAVRRILLPKVVFVLIKLITEQNSLTTMRKLVYILCEDSREILKEFTTSEISSIFKAIEEYNRSASTTLTQLPKETLQNSHQ